MNDLADLLCSPKIGIALVIVAAMLWVRGCSPNTQPPRDRPPSH
jgi:hypothetical protein